VGLQGFPYVCRSAPALEGKKLFVGHPTWALAFGNMNTMVFGWYGCITALIGFYRIHLETHEGVTNRN
jgi:hypothetical protein